MYAFNNLGAALFLAMSAYPFFAHSRRNVVAKSILVSVVIISIRVLKVELNV